MLTSRESENVRKLVAEYTRLRIQFYLNKDDDQRKSIGERTARLQSDLWQAVRASIGSRSIGAYPLPLHGQSRPGYGQGPIGPRSRAHSACASMPQWVRHANRCLLDHKRSPSSLR